MQDATDINPVKQRILEFTFEAFNQKGYKAISMDLVARELRISKKTIYQHFRTKEEILETSLSTLFDRLEEKVATLESKKLKRASVLEMLSLYLEYKREVSSLLREEVSQALPYIESRIDHFENQIFKRPLTRILKELRTQNQVEYPTPTRDIADGLLAMTEGLLGQPTDKSGFFLERLVRGLKKRK